MKLQYDEKAHEADIEKLERFLSTMKNASHRKKQFLHRQKLKEAILNSNSRADWRERGR